MKCLYFSCLVNLAVLLIIYNLGISYLNLEGCLLCGYSGIAVQQELIYPNRLQGYVKVK